MCDDRHKGNKPRASHRISRDKAYIGFIVITHTHTSEHACLRNSSMCVYTTIGIKCACAASRGDVLDKMFGEIINSKYAPRI